VTRIQHPLIERRKEAVDFQRPLVEDALRTVGEKPPTTYGKYDLRNRPVSSGPMHDVYVGSALSLGAGPTKQDWLVTGVERDGTVKLAYRANDHVIHGSKPWSVVAEHAPQLFEGHTVTWKGEKRFVGEPLEHNTPNPAQRVWLEPRSGRGDSIAANWHDVVAENKLARKRPVARLPRDGMRAAELRWLTGDTRFVVSHAAVPPRLIGTNSKPAPPHVRPAVKQMDDILSWLERVPKTPALTGQEQFFTFHVDDIPTVGNAYAHSNGMPQVTTGIHDVHDRERYLHMLPGDSRRTYRWAANLIASHSEGVHAHEAGHLAMGALWGFSSDRLAAATDLQYAEDGVVNEAVADLYGGAYARTDDLGVRDLDRESYFDGNLERLRGFLAAGKAHSDIHNGTELITKPMVGLAREHGWDVVGEITGAAVQKIGKDIILGDVTAVDIPRMARELRDAAAWRYGAESETVKALNEGWRALGVLH
jgi:hypothetical protein